MMVLKWIEIIALRQNGIEKNKIHSQTNNGIEMNKNYSCNEMI